LYWRREKKVNGKCVTVKRVASRKTKPSIDVDPADEAIRRFNENYYKAKNSPLDALAIFISSVKPITVKSTIKDIRRQNLAGKPCHIAKIVKGKIYYRAHVFHSGRR
jgi:hypothetical protein